MAAWPLMGRVDEAWVGWTADFESSQGRGQATSLHVSATCHRVTPCLPVVTVRCWCSAVVEQFAMAAMAGDEEGKNEPLEDIAEFDERNPNRRILPMQRAFTVGEPKRWIWRWDRNLC